MPYIEKKYRGWIDSKLDPLLEAIDKDPNITPGEANYIITNVILGWLPVEPRYEDYNAAIGVLESVKLELYRRMVAPYEDQKKEENGDVY